MIWHVSERESRAIPGVPNDRARASRGNAVQLNSIALQSNLGVEAKSGTMMPGTSMLAGNFRIAAAESRFALEDTLVEPSR